MIAIAGLDTDIGYSLADIPLEKLSVGLFFLAWLIGGISTLLAALCYAELVAMLPRSGGPYEYLKQAYPDIVTFLRGWAMFFVSETASIVAVSLVFSTYSSYLIANTTGVEIGIVGEAGLSLAIIWLLTFANFFGVFASGILQNIFSALKFLSLILIILFSFSSDGNPQNFSTHFWPREFGWDTVLGIGAALRFGFFAFSGWEGATYVAEEVKNPSVNLPRSLFLGIGAIMILYFGVNAAYLYQLDPAMIVVAKKQIASQSMKAALGAGGGIFLAAVVMFSTFGNVNTQILVKARTWYAMARDGLFFQSLSKLSKRGTPDRSMIAQGIWASILLTLAVFSDIKSSSGNSVNAYDKIISFFSFTSAIFNVLTFLAVIVLRKKMKHVKRPFMVPWFPFTISITLLIYTAFMILTLIDKPVESLFGVALTSTGLVYYYFFVKNKALRSD